MSYFVTDTMIIDIRDDSFIYPGDPIPREAMNPGTLKTLLDKGGILPYSTENCFKMNPKHVIRKEVEAIAGLSGLKVSEPPAKANSLDDLTRMERGLAPTSPEHKEPLPRSLIVQVKGQKAEEENDEPRNLVNGEVAEAPKKAPPIEAIWSYNPEELVKLEEPVLLSVISERCKEYHKEVPHPETFENKEAMIAFMSKEYVPTIRDI